MFSRVATWVLLATLGLLFGCASSRPVTTRSPATLAPPTQISSDLSKLPEAQGRIAAAVYGFRDQTGQYKPAPDSSFSTSVTQGAGALLIKALRDSRWFIPVERENLQNLLTERKIIRALEGPNAAQTGQALPQLMAAQIILEGAIVGYESNVKTGGAGMRYLGVGGSDQYRVDQVTVNLRTVDTRTGQVLQSISTTKTIYSIQLDFGGFRFVSLKSLLEYETGFSQNEPVQLCVREAIETGLVHLITQGIRDRLWGLKNAADFNLPIVQNYLKAYDQQLKMTPDDYASQSTRQLAPIGEGKAI